MAAIAASRASTLSVLQWTTVLQKGKTIQETVATTTKKENTWERTIVAEHPGPARRPTERQRRILFPRRAGAPLKQRREALDITLRVNMPLSEVKFPFHIHMYPLNYNEKGNLTCQMASTSTSSMLLPQHRELALRVVRQVHHDIINTTGYQR